jgi:GntR family transcriptional regulator
VFQIKLDFRSEVPIYNQIAEQVQKLVARGELKEGDQLPTVRELATELRVNFNTVARAYRLLDDARLISTQRGRGTYIWEQPSEETVRRLRMESLTNLTRHYLEESLGLGFSVTEVRSTLENELRNLDQADVLPVEDQKFHEK